ncbi:MAG: hypothetical protein MJ093_04095 [Saccharofermentans sp.]|nr:hypothetical protein [Saccharofermentans sp.]
MTLYDICWYFVLYSFIGWVIEVIFHAVTLGKIMNRGFLNGPVCPVYGFGMIAVLSVYEFVGIDNSIVIFIEGIILTTTIELLAGFILDKAFHARWWNYSNVPFNLHGYICLKFSIIWGAAVVFVLKIFNPTLYALTIYLLSPKYGWPLLLLLLLVFIVDTVVTALTLIGLNKQLKELDSISKKLHVLSDKLTEDISLKSINAAQKVQNTQIQYSLGKSELQDKYDEIRNRILAHRHYGSGRLINAFPNVIHNEYHHLLEDLKNRIQQPKAN